MKKFATNKHDFNDIIEFKVARAVGRCEGAHEGVRNVITAINQLNF